MALRGDLSRLPPRGGGIHWYKTPTRSAGDQLKRSRSHPQVLRPRLRPLDRPMPADSFLSISYVSITEAALGRPVALSFPFKHRQLPATTVEISYQWGNRPARCIALMVPARTAAAMIRIPGPGQVKVLLDHDLLRHFGPARTWYSGARLDSVPAFGGSV